jgi:eukaryotic-like serine/threonine-protein kinase
LLKAALPYEMGQPAQAISLNLYPVYVRANANLDQHVSAAAAEFEKILNTPGVALNEPVAALARLGMARAYAAAGDNAKARSAYEDFLEIWKQADPDIPVLKQATTEYAKMLASK